MKKLTQKMFRFSVAMLLGGLLARSGLMLFAGEAIPSYHRSVPLIVGYVWAGAGFAFSPRTNLAVTALGFGGSDLATQAYEVSLWDTNGAKIATSLVTTSSPLLNWTHYETIRPLLLAADQVYYLRSVGIDNGMWLGEAVVTAGPNRNGDFSVAPDLTYLGFAHGTNSAGVFPDAVEADTALMVGPNFQYTLGPVLLMEGLQVSGGQASIAFRVAGGTAASFRLLEASQPGGPWSTNLNAVLSTNLPGASYSFTAPAAGPARFYRLQAP